MEILKKLSQKIDRALLERQATNLADDVTKIMIQTLQDVGIIESAEELERLTEGELMQRFQDLGKEMAEMKPNTLQTFVNRKLDRIKIPERRKHARLFLQQGIKEFISEK